MSNFTQPASERVLTGKVAFVQGGSRGIGAAIAKHLARAGAAVAITYVSSAKPAQDVVRDIEAGGGRALALRADSTNVDELKEAIETAATAFGRIDVLVNNAGVAAMAPLDDFKLEDFDRIVAVNVRSVFVATQAAARHMPEGGRIINIGSTNAERVPFAGGAVYAMSKSALTGLTKGLARDLGPRGITINTVQPGPVDTDMNPDDSEFATSLKGLLAIKRYAHVDEIAGFVTYLAGPDTGYITGASLLIDGGFAA
jgi:3-oxoacyl-[acyl-carrier protein] reductase